MQLVRTSSFPEVLRYESVEILSPLCFCSRWFPVCFVCSHIIPLTEFCPSASLCSSSIQGDLHTFVSNPLTILQVCYDQLVLILVQSPGFPLCQVVQWSFQMAAAPGSSQPDCFNSKGNNAVVNPYSWFLAKRIFWVKTYQIKTKQKSSHQYRLGVWAGRAGGTCLLQRRQPKVSDTIPSST